jgi:TolA-binding protein
MMYGIILLLPICGQPPALPPIDPGPGAPDSPRLIPPETSRPNPPADAPRAAPGVSDIEKVERVVGARRAYHLALIDLLEFYRRTGDAERARWVEDELRQFLRVPQYAYRLELDVPPPTLRPLTNNADANELYRRALTYKDRGFGVDYLDNQKRAELLFQLILSNHPQCTKISDAAYHLGEIYESRAFQQYPRAAAYFERCYQWNPTTSYDARIRAARIYDRYLRDKTKAIEVYRLAREHETEPSRIGEATRRIAELSRK